MAASALWGRQQGTWANTDLHRNSQGAELSGAGMSRVRIGEISSTELQEVQRLAVFLLREW